MNPGSTPPPARYPEIEVRGTRLEMGEQIGEAAREQIHGFAEIALERVNKTVHVSREKLHLPPRLGGLIRKWSFSGCWCLGIVGQLRSCLPRAPLAQSQ